MSELPEGLGSGRRYEVGVARLAVAGSCAVTGNGVSLMEGDCSVAKGGRKDPV